MHRLLLIVAVMVGSTACASTSSTVIPVSDQRASKMAIVPFDGQYGTQAVDLISQEFAKRNIAVVEGSKVKDLLAIDTDFSEGSPDSVTSLQAYGEQLDVRFLFTGTVEAIGGPLYSFDHVKMTMRLIDISTGQTRWIGNYGNSMWSSAISTQGDLQRGAKHIVREFDESGADDIIK
jgi:TolB-like protein